MTFGRSTFLFGLQLLGALHLVVGCASTYRIVSVPESTEVFHQKGSNKAFLGQTPFSFSKSTLPDTSPFTLRFEKAGFEPRELLVSPNDETSTTISVNLKQNALANNDEALKRTRDVIKQIFSVQEYVYSKRYLDALSILVQLEQKEPMLPEVYVLRGSIYVLLNDKTNAKAQWEKALMLDPTLEAVKVKIAELKVKEEKR